MQATNLLDVDSFIMTSLFQALRQWGRRESKRYAKTEVGGGGGGGGGEKGGFQVRAFSIPADPIISTPGTRYIMS